MPGKAETEGVVIIAPLEVQEAPSGTRTGLTSLQGALAILLVASQLVAFVQLPEAHGGSGAGLRSDFEIDFLGFRVLILGVWFQVLGF